MHFIKLGLMELGKVPNLPENIRQLVQALDQYVTAQLVADATSFAKAQQSRLVGNHGYTMYWLNPKINWRVKCANG